MPTTKPRLVICKTSALPALQLLQSHCFFYLNLNIDITRFLSLNMSQNPTPFFTYFQGLNFRLPVYMCQNYRFHSVRGPRVKVQKQEILI